MVQRVAAGMVLVVALSLPLAAGQANPTGSPGYVADLARRRASVLAALGPDARSRCS